MDVINTTGNKAFDEEIERIRKRLSVLETATGVTQVIPTQTDPAIDFGSGEITVQEVDGDPSIPSTTLEFDQSDGFAVSSSADGLGARIDRTAATTTPGDVASAGAAGTSTEAANKDHVHKGVHSFAKSGSTALYGDVTISPGTGITITPSGQDNVIASTVSGGSSKGKEYLEPQLATLYSNAYARSFALNGGHQQHVVVFRSVGGGAQWKTGLRDNVASTNNQKLVTVFVFDTTEAAHTYDFTVYTAAASSGVTNVVAGPLSWSTAATFSVNTGTAGILTITTTTLSDGAFQDNREYFLRLERSSTDSATSDIWLIDAYFTFDTD